MKNWTYERVMQSVCGFFIRDKDGSIVARVMKVGVPHNGDFSLPAEENARLIAASPKMLAALECFVAACEGVNSEYSDLHEATELAKAAIAEATGRTE